MLQALLLQTNWGTEAATEARDMPGSTCQGWGLDLILGYKHEEMQGGSIHGPL